MKASGLAAGKGVIVAATVEEACAAVDSMLVDNAFGEAGEGGWDGGPRPRLPSCRMASGRGPPRAFGAVGATPTAPTAARPVGPAPAKPCLGPRRNPLHSFCIGL